MDFGNSYVKTSKHFSFRRDQPTNNTEVKRRCIEKGISQNLVFHCHSEGRHEWF